MQVSGLKYTYVATGPMGQRIQAATIIAADGTSKEIDPCQTYTVLVNDYMAGE